VERAITLAERGQPLTRDHLDQGRGYGDAKSPGLDGTLREIVNQLEMETIRATLERFEGNVRLTADALGLSRPGLRYKMRRLGLED
jgi:DNA-binding NtrC family response regulator